MASSTKIPIENIRANKDTLLSVKPAAQDANKVTVSVNTTAVPTMAASLRPSVKKTRATTQEVAKINFSISFVALSFAVTP